LEIFPGTRISLSGTPFIDAFVNLWTRRWSRRGVLHLSAKKNCGIFLLSFTNELTGFDALTGFLALWVTGAGAFRCVAWATRPTTGVSATQRLAILIGPPSTNQADTATGARGDQRLNIDCIAPHSRLNID
jgi:hypothetical protein